MQRVMTRLLALMLLSIGSAATVQAQTWNLASNFSNTNGGSNRWSYGFYTAGLSPSSFSAFSTYQLRDDNRLATWYQGGNVDPNIQKNVTTSAYLQPGTDITFNPGEVTFGPFRGPTVARWTAVEGGVFNISAMFQTVQTRNGAPNAYVYGNTQELFFQTVTPTGVSWSSAGPVTLAANEWIDFVVWGNDQNNKTTQVQATITAVPEPGAFVLVLTGLLGLGAAARRRQRA
jgi:hypothetical protein